MLPLRHNVANYLHDWYINVQPVMYAYNTLIHLYHTF